MLNRDAGPSTVPAFEKTLMISPHLDISLCCADGRYMHGSGDGGYGDGGYGGGRGGGRGRGRGGGSYGGGGGYDQVSLGHYPACSRQSRCSTLRLDMCHDTEANKAVCWLRGQLGTIWDLTQPSSLRLMNLVCQDQVWKCIYDGLQLSCCC